MTVKLLTEHQLEFLNLKLGCIGSSESTLVKMPHRWKSLFMAQISYLLAKKSGLGSYRILYNNFDQ